MSPLTASEIEVIKVCKDQNGISGCQAADIDYMATGDGFDVTVLGDITTVDGAGCTSVMLETDIDNPSDAGLFYYTIGDGVDTEDLGAIVAETGSVVIPEMTVIGSVLVLGAAGFMIAKKRKNA